MDAVSFQGLEAGMRLWFDAPPPAGTGAGVAYADTGRAWVAAGAPLAAPADLGAAAARFVAAARRAGRRASFFATGQEIPGLRAAPIGEQPVFAPAAWLAGGARSRGLREQLRRSRAKGVRVREVAPGELAAATPLRARIDALAAAWLAARPMEPMGFLVALEPFHFLEEHVYLVAEVGDRPVGFLSAVPIPARRGWFAEDLVRGAGAPSGTSEALLVALAGRVAADGLVTLGLAPLTGPVPAWQRAVRALANPLYDFDGLRRFRERLHPDAWEPVLHAFPPDGRGAAHLADALRAFAGGSLSRFALRSLTRHPAGPPWAVAVSLGGWTIALAALGLAGGGRALGLPPPLLGGWLCADALFAWLLLRFARRPRPSRLVLASALAGADAAVYLAHLAGAPPPGAPWHAALRVAATGGPILAAAALAWATALRARAGGRARGARGERPAPLNGPRRAAPARSARSRRRARR